MLPNLELVRLCKIELVNLLVMYVCVPDPGVFMCVRPSVLRRHIGYNYPPEREMGRKERAREREREREIGGERESERGGGGGQEERQSGQRERERANEREREWGGGGGVGGEGSVRVFF